MEVLGTVTTIATKDMLTATVVVAMDASVLSRLIVAMQMDISDIIIAIYALEVVVLHVVLPVVLQMTAGIMIIVTTVQLDKIYIEIIMDAVVVHASIPIIKEMTLNLIASNL